MFKVTEPVHLDPDGPTPQVVIETKGLVVEKHKIELPAFKEVPKWEESGTNVPQSGSDLGTPDIYEIPHFTRQNGNVLEIFVDLFNVTEEDKNYDLKVEIRQGDYEPDVVIDETGTLGTDSGSRTETHGVFVPLRLMT